MSTAEFPPLPPPHVRLGVGGVLLQSGRALVNRAVYRTRFTIPGGYVEAGESLVGALAREFEEETGVTVRVGRLLLTYHKVLNAQESDVYFAFALDHLAGQPTARPPEIAEVREVSVAEAEGATWISGVSRTAIRLATQPSLAWPSSPWKGSDVPGVSVEAYHASGGEPDQRRHG
ncbi:MAG TPA: NUDIX domain-containing protein [Thermoplasmata archaeon]|nr:NUDIX domain-containing protein [Thermoplasmata archaeon]